MDKLESNIQEIQSFVNQCVGKGYSSYSYSFSVKREFLSPEQARAATEKELERATDELVALLRQNPILKSLSDNIEKPDFLWNSTFIEVLSSGEKRKYSVFNVDSLDTDAYKHNHTQYDGQLPYLSAVINYGIQNRYISYLKEYLPAEEKEHKDAGPTPETAKTKPIALPENEPQDFESDFDERQKELLTRCFNELKIFKKPVTVKTFGDILTCRLKEPLRIARNKNKLLAYFFSSLDNRGLITREWQAVCAKNELFRSSGKGIIMQQGNFSTAVSQNNEFPPKDCEIIDNYLKQLKRH